MDEIELYKKIEKLNLENIKLKQSNEYLLGKKIKKTNEYIKKFKFISLIKKIIQNKKINKLNNHGELENNYCVKNEFTQKPKIAVYTCITR